MKPGLRRNLAAIFRGAIVVAQIFLAANFCGAQTNRAVTFSKDFEGGSFAKIERVAENSFRCFVEGQSDERWRNRQATWYFFRIDGVANRDIAITLTDLVGEYNDKPGACAMNPETIPVFSVDGRAWQHFAAMEWDDAKKEATVRFRVAADTVWVAHIPPYTTAQLDRVLADVARCACARVETIGKTVKGRELRLVTATDFSVPDAKKKVVWIIARQHAWEAGTSFVAEGAMRFVTGDSAQARASRERVVFKFLPMLDPDGVAAGKVRFNANGFDVNRHWSEVSPRESRLRDQMPEIWHAKKAILDHIDAGGRIDLMINLHNTETGEFFDSQADAPAVVAMLKRLDAAMTAKTTFDPSRAIGFRVLAATDTNSLFRERGVPVVLLEQRISYGRKLGKAPNIEDRLRFGRELITTAAERVLE
jgi:hypothetical protein